MRRHSARRSSSRRRLGRLWNRFFHRPRVRSQIPLLDPSHTSQTVLGAGIINRTEGTTPQSLPASPEGTNIDTEPCSLHQDFHECESSHLQPEPDATELSPSDILSSACTAALAELEHGQRDKAAGAEDSPSSEVTPTSKAETEDTFRDPLSERQPCGVSGAEIIHSNRDNLLSQEPCRPSFKKWVSPYSDSPGNIPVRADSQHPGCLHSYHEEPLGIHTPCCHSMEVPILESPVPEISTSDDESLLVC